MTSLTSLWATFPHGKERMIVRLAGNLYEVMSKSTFGFVLKDRKGLTLYVTDQAKLPIWKLVKDSWEGK